jgi:hypothetical protein
MSVGKIGCPLLGLDTGHVYRRSNWLEATTNIVNVKLNIVQSSQVLILD